MSGAFIWVKTLAIKFRWRLLADSVQIPPITAHRGKIIRVVRKVCCKTHFLFLLLLYEHPEIFKQLDTDFGALTKPVG